jgi:hypothetical protein
VERCDSAPAYVRMTIGFVAAGVRGLTSLLLAMDVLPAAHVDRMHTSRDCRTVPGI